MYSPDWILLFNNPIKCRRDSSEWSSLICFRVEKISESGVCLLPQSSSSLLRGSHGHGAANVLCSSFTPEHKHSVLSTNLRLKSTVVVFLLFLFILFPLDVHPCWKMVSPMIVARMLRYVNSQWKLICGVCLASKSSPSGSPCHPAPQHNRETVYSPPPPVRRINPHHIQKKRKEKEKSMSTFRRDGHRLRYQIEASL